MIKEKNCDDNLLNGILYTKKRGRGFIGADPCVCPVKNEKDLNTIYRINRDLQDKK